MAFYIGLILSASLFAMVEIQIEGADGWAAQLPTWRVENRWTRLFFGKRPLTGYHLYVLLFVLLMAHAPFFLAMAVPDLARRSARRFVHHPLLGAGRLPLVRLQPAFRRRASSANNTSGGTPRPGGGSCPGTTGCSCRSAFCCCTSAGRDQSGTRAGKHTLLTVAAHTGLAHASPTARRRTRRVAVPPVGHPASEGRKSRSARRREPCAAGSFAPTGLAMRGGGGAVSRRLTPWATFCRPCRGWMSVPRTCTRNTGG